MWAADALKEWHDFYLLVGTAGATLLALLFVAVSLGTGFLTEERQEATRTFLSPVVIHFTSMLERAKETTRFGKYTYIEYARFADDLVILIDAYPRHDWLMAAVEKRLREELADLQVEINEEKSRIVDLGRRRKLRLSGIRLSPHTQSSRGMACQFIRRSSKRRTALQRELKDVFRRHQSQPVDRVVQLINPILRVPGWPRADTAGLKLGYH